MVDIAASLSLIPTSLPFDPTVVLGAESSDNQAFGDILAGQVKAAASNDADHGLLPGLFHPTGNRQSGGKILPGVIQMLPDAAIAGAADPAAQVIPKVTAPVDARDLIAVKPVLAALAIRLAKALPQNAEIADPDLKASGTPPERHSGHSLIKMLAKAIRGQHIASDQALEAVSEDQDPTTSETATIKPTTSTPLVDLPIAVDFLEHSNVTGLWSQTEVQTNPASAENGVSSRAGVPQLPVDQPSLKPFDMSIATAALLKKPSSQMQLFETAIGDPAQQAAPVTSRSATVQDEVLSLPVLTVPAATRTDAPALVVTLAAVPIGPAGRVTSARIKVSTDAIDAPALPVKRPTTASMLDRAMIAEGPQPALVPVAGESQAPPGNPTQVVPGAASTLDVRLRDFAVLVDRLVQARSASASQSTHAAVTHAEFGQVSLHFQQDGGDLKVGMSSADPGFAVAAQTAQTGMPVERQNLNSESQSRSQPSSQSQSNSSSSREAAGQRGADTGGGQSRGGQGRPHGGTSSSNPSPRWADRNQSQGRSGVFA